MLSTRNKTYVRLQSFSVSLFAAALITGIAPATSAQQNKPAPTELKTETLSAEELEQVNELMSQLDSSNYEARENATEELIAIGSLAIRPLAVHFFESSSEAGWRINRVLEGIGTSGSEDDFLRTAAIIQKLFGTQNSGSVQKLQQLQRQWRIKRRKDAAAKLRRQGFKIENANAGLGGEIELGGPMAREILIRRAGIIEMGITKAPVDEDQETKPDVTKWSDPRDERQQLILQIEKILANDTETNRELIAQILPQNLSLNSIPACQITLPKNWEPSSSVTELLAAMSPIGSVQMVDQKIDNSLMNLFSAEEQLSMMSFSNCNFQAVAGKELAMPPNINELAFDGQLPPKSFFKSIKARFSMMVQNAELTVDIANQLYASKILYVTLNDVELTEASLSRLLRTPSLAQVTFTLCQFDLDWLDGARQNRPELSIVANPVSFLGVQGPMDISNRSFRGCQISQVVPGTGAAKAGMKANDIVIAMGGQKIATFEDLRLLISQKRPAEKMQLKILRGKEPIELEIELGAPNQ